jgi:rhamnulokinase
VAGPVEATAAGNVLVQAITLGQVPSLTAARQIVRTSMETVTVSPEDAAGWRQQHRRFEKFF